MNKFCTWREINPEYGIWKSDCGVKFSFTAYGLDENEFRYCFNCGKRIKTAHTKEK